MPAQCTVCSSGLRALVEADLIVGKTPTVIARGLDGVLTVASIRRHGQNHLHTSPRGTVAHGEPLTGPELLVSLDRLARSADKLHSDAMSAGNTATALRAAAQSQSAIAELLRHKDVRAEAVSAAAKFGTVSRALVHAARTHPEIVHGLADAARAIQESDLARDLDALATKYNTKENHA